MPSYQPPFQITTAILTLVAQISERLGAWSAKNSETLTPRLRRNNRIKTIQASLQIEQNTLSVEQVTALLEGKHVLGLPQEIQEVKNAFKVYEMLSSYQPDSSENLLSAHEILMQGLVDEAGKYRSGGVGIYHGTTLVHMAPPASQINRLMFDLFDWIKQTDTHPLVASCVFHYEFEYIHPFADGNGRMGRLWQTLILAQYRPELAFLPVETVIRDQQSDYYAALRESDKTGDATAFTEFMLTALNKALEQALESADHSAQSDSHNSNNKTEKSSEKNQLDSEKSSEKNHNFVLSELNALTTDDQIIAVIGNNPKISAKKIAEQLDLSSRTIEKHIAKLKSQNRLTRIGAAKGGHWQVNQQ